jgi:large subunit ribosomal protein L32
MSVSKRRQTSSKRKSRASHFALKAIKLSTCSKCKKAVKPHHACGFCGTYNKREAIKIRPNKEERDLIKKGKKVKKDKS